MYTIELYCGEDRGWEPAWAYPKRYTLGEADAILNDLASNKYKTYQYRKVGASKPYRRHAAVTPLELRGAIAMLRSACKYIADNVDKHVSLSGYAEWAVMYNARLECERALESLERGE